MTINIKRAVPAYFPFKVNKNHLSLAVCSSLNSRRALFSEVSNALTSRYCVNATDHLWLIPLSHSILFSFSSQALNCWYSWVTRPPLCPLAFTEAIEALCICNTYRIIYIWLIYTCKPDFFKHFYLPDIFYLPAIKSLSLASSNNLNVFSYVCV